MSREWVEVPAWDSSIHPSERRRGVLVEDGRDGEPTAESAIDSLLRASQHDASCRTKLGYACSCGLDAAHRVVYRALNVLCGECGRREPIAGRPYCDDCKERL